MKTIAALVFAIALLFAPTAKSQSRILLGASGTNEFDNLSAGVLAGAELQYKRFELDLTDVYSPYETHVGLGNGHANIASLSPTMWFGRTGVTGKIEDSGYSVTQVSKTAFYTSGGFQLKRYVAGMPSRISFGGIDQINNGIVNGVESSHLYGGYVGIDTRLGCVGSACIRMSERIVAGHALTQGNPQCDGTYGNGNQLGESPCPRGSYVGGGMTLSLSLEFPRHKGHEADLF